MGLMKFLGVYIYIYVYMGFIGLVGFGSPLAGLPCPWRSRSCAVHVGLPRDRRPNPLTSVVAPVVAFSLFLVQGSL